MELSSLVNTFALISQLPFIHLIQFVQYSIFSSNIQRRIGNRIVRLQNQEGEWLMNLGRIKKEFFDFFKQLYGFEQNRIDNEISDSILNLVTEQMNAELLAPITAVFQMGRLKAPRPYGYPGLFYQTHWDIIKQDVVELVKDFYCTSILNPNLNQTLITLVPKIKNLLLQLLL